MIKIPPLPYSDRSLLPHMSSETVRTHYGKHTKAYYDKTNQLIKDTDHEGQTLDELVRSLLPSSKGTALYNNACQAWNHTFFWDGLSPDKNKQRIVDRPIYDRIATDFGSFANFKQQFAKAAESVFGSGWVWLVLNNNTLAIITTSNGDTPATTPNVTPLLACDVWEHAYYLDVKNRRTDYVTDHFFELINWERVNDLFDDHI